MTVSGWKRWTQLILLTWRPLRTVVFGHAPFGTAIALVECISASERVSFRSSIRSLLRMDRPTRRIEDLLLDIDLVHDPASGGGLRPVGGGGRAVQFHVTGEDFPGIVKLKLPVDDNSEQQGDGAHPIKQSKLRSQFSADPSRDKEVQNECRGSDRDQDVPVVDNDCMMNDLARAGSSYPMDSSSCFHRGTM